MVKVEDLSIVLGNKKILDKVNVSFKEKKITSIIGVNGCGKSTLVKAIAGFYIEANSSIKIAGAYRNSKDLKYFAKNISFLMQFMQIPNHMSIYEFVLYGRLPHKKRFKPYSLADKEIVEWALTKTNLLSLKNEQISSLSGGQRQRVFLAMILSQKTPIIVLDEPTNHLDIKYQYELLDLIKELNVQEELTIIMVLHDINLALRYSDEIVVMSEGKIIKQTNTSDVLDEKLIQDIFGIRCKITTKYKHPNMIVL